MNAIIREADSSDADQLAAYLMELAAEPDRALQLQFSPLANVAEQAAAWIQSHGLVLVAEADDAIVGVLTGQGSEDVLTRHAVTFGVSLRKGFRDAALGIALIRRGLEWARSRPHLRRVQLEVLTDQEDTIQLYEQMGFETEGWRLQAYYVGHRYVDTYLMAQQIA